MCAGARVCRCAAATNYFFLFLKGVKFALSPIIYMYFAQEKPYREKFLAEEKGATIFVSRGEKWWQVGAKQGRGQAWAQGVGVHIHARRYSRTYACARSAFILMGKMQVKKCNRGVLSQFLKVVFPEGEQNTERKTEQKTERQNSQNEIIVLIRLIQN